MCSSRKVKTLPPPPPPPPPPEDSAEAPAVGDSALKKRKKPRKRVTLDSLRIDLGAPSSSGIQSPGA